MGISEAGVLISRYEQMFRSDARRAKIPCLLPLQQRRLRGNRGGDDSVQPFPCLSC